MADDRSTFATDPSLLRRIRDLGDQQAWQLFEETYRGLIRKFCHRKGLQDADAGDVAQEVLTKVFKAVRSFEYDPQRGRFRDWLGCVVRGRLAEFFGRGGQETQRTHDDSSAVDLAQMVAVDSDADWTAEFHDHILRTAMQRIRDAFEPHNWQAFQATWLDGRSAREVAGELQMPVSAVYVAKHRVLQRLQREVATLAEDLPQLFVGHEKR
jgi:RNA polymerase sigma-70 factor (ECF subfamily)